MRLNQGGAITPVSPRAVTPKAVAGPVVISSAPVAGPVGPVGPPVVYLPPAPVTVLSGPALTFSTYQDGYYSIGSGDINKGLDLHITLRNVSNSAKSFGFKTGGYPIYLYKSGINIKYGLMNNNIFYQIVPSSKPLDAHRQVFNIIGDTLTYGPVSNHKGSATPKYDVEITNKYVYLYLKFLPVQPLSNSSSIINYDPFAVAAAPAPASDVTSVSNTDPSLAPANPEAAAAEALTGGRRKSRKSKRQRGGGNTFNRSISPQAVRANPLNLDDYKGDNAIDTKT
jgi:hypothetical protein